MDMRVISDQLQACWKNLTQRLAVFYFISIPLLHLQIVSNQNQLLLVVTRNIKESELKLRLENNPITSLNFSRKPKSVTQGWDDDFQLW